MLDYQIGTPDQKGFLIAHAIEVGLLIPLAAILALGSVFAVRRRQDPARNVFLSLRVAGALYFVSLLLETAQFAAAAASNDEAVSSLSFEPHDRLAAVSEFLRNTSRVAIIVTAIEFSLATYYAATRKLLMGVRVGGLGLAVVVVALALAVLGGSQKFWTDFYDEDFDVPFSNLSDILVTDRGLAHRAVRPWIALQGVILVLFFAASLAAAALATFVFHAAKSSDRANSLRKASSMLLTANGLNLLVWSWNMAPAVWNLKYAGMTFSHISSFHPITTPIWWFAASGVIENWTLFVVLTLGLAVGMFKKDGLWTTPQPWGGTVGPNTTQPVKYFATPQQQPVQPHVHHAGVPGVAPGGHVPPLNQTPGMNYVVSPETLAALSPEARQRIMENGSPRTGQV